MRTMNCYARDLQRLLAIKDDNENEQRQRPKTLYERRRYRFWMDRVRMIVNEEMVKIRHRLCQLMEEWHAPELIIESKYKHKMYGELWDNQAFKPSEKSVMLDGGELNKTLTLEFSILQLKRKMDFLNLILSYPMRLLDKNEENASKSLAEEFLKIVAYYRSTQRFSPAKEYERGLHRLENLEYFKVLEAFVPGDITEKIYTEQSSLSLHTQQADHILAGNEKLSVPQEILNMALDLAVEQLKQNLASRDIHFLMISTMSNGNIVREKLQLVLEDKVAGTFIEKLYVDVLDFPGNADVQQEIARLMQLQFGDSSLLKSYIGEELSSKRYMVILHDAHGKLDLYEVGIPETNFAGVLIYVTGAPSSHCDIRLKMDLEIRTEDHLLSWELFCRYAGIELVHSSSDILNSAMGIVEECRGHLLAILLMASSLKNVKEVKLWALALDKLRSHNCIVPYEIDESRMLSRVMVNAFINVVWENMEIGVRYCLMRCLKNPPATQGMKPDILISDWSSSGYEGEQILNGLLNGSVLLGNVEKKLILPEETYDILKLLDSSGMSQVYIKQAGIGLTEPPKVEQWHGAVEIHLMDNNLCELPESPDCPDLKILFLQGNTDLTIIPTLFFDHMPLLHVLDLSYTSIQSLPSSIFKLATLREFLLRGCELFMELPSEIGKLKKLEKLNLDGTQITHLPIEVGELINLKSLTLSFYEYDSGYGMRGMQSTSIIAPGVISNLQQLVELSIDVSPDDHRWVNQVEIIIREICGLEYLNTLKLFIPEAQLLKLIKENCVSRITSFEIVVGHHMKRIISRVPREVEAKFKRWDKSLKFVNGMNVPDEIKMVLKDVEAFFLDRHMNITTLSEFGLENFKIMGFCLLAECNEIQTIFDGRDFDHDYQQSWTYLAYLGVYYMKNLRRIWRGPIGKKCLLFLRVLTLHTCRKLETIFTLDILANVTCLEELIVEDCPRVSTLVSHESSNHLGETFLPRLRKVFLLYLPELISISNGVHIGLQLEKIGFYDCPKLESLSILELSSKSLKFIKGQEKWWEALRWRESEWGQDGRPDKIGRIFSPIDEELDVMNQLQADEV
ncbi:Disease resistance protein [Quillaja saponaria]|uniref:Disease resistance protein n=1 Tax=Quillaja saponaria TaxID=32244 RepID=A0AAD7KUY8_QUISA|nr:Disease resistance protein [Quillaja saponaria]KAJ7946540.1 Disease resistance protein [Quillaja saponaria]